MIDLAPYDPYMDHIRTIYMDHIWTIYMDHIICIFMPHFWRTWLVRVSSLTCWHVFGKVRRSEFCPEFCTAVTLWIQIKSLGHPTFGLQCRTSFSALSVDLRSEGMMSAKKCLFLSRCDAQIIQNCPCSKGWSCYTVGSVRWLILDSDFAGNGRHES